VKPPQVEARDLVLYIQMELCHNRSLQVLDRECRAPPPTVHVWRALGGS
jgi:hypothetical protein